MRRPKKLLVAVAFIAAILMMPRGPSWAAPGDPGTGLAATDHDFTTLTNKTTTIGLCTFCHTPHKAFTTQLLWNHKLSTNTFSWDAASTTAGTTFPTFAGNTYKGPTAKCLSCHDGSVAVGDVALYKETMPASLNPDTMNTLDSTGMHTIGGGGDLSGNHPVAMPYPANGTQNTYNTVTTGANYTASEWNASPLSPARLYKEDGSGNITYADSPATGTSNGIECSSCHDPHNKKSVEDLFLLGMLTGTDSNYICLKCHIK